MRRGVAAGRRRTAAAFNPAALSAPLHAWYDAQTQTAANGASLTTLTDQTVNARTATKNAGTISYNTAGINGKPTFDFVAGTYATTATFTAVSGATAINVFTVAQFTTVGDRTLLSAASPGFSMACGTLSTGSAWLANRGASVSGGTTNTSAHRFRWFLAASNAATSTVTVDGTGVAGPGAAGFGAPTAWRLGANSSGFEQFVGKIGEMLIFTGNLSAPDAAAVDAYLTAKWGI